MLKKYLLAIAIGILFVGLLFIFGYIFWLLGGMWGLIPFLVIGIPFVVAWYICVFTEVGEVPEPNQQQLGDGK